MPCQWQQLLLSIGARNFMTECELQKTVLVLGPGVTQLSLNVVYILPYI